ncbi:MAG: VCBS repeat-containing protein, partial [bacterium]|nr:VCBS repeat-containing protein [bacterium]
KVSSTKRYLAGGDDIFSTDLPTPAGDEWFSNRGGVRGMKVNAEPLASGHAGTYFGIYDKTIFWDECMLASDLPCENDRKATTIASARVVVAMDGAGSCTWKEYKQLATLHLLHNDYTGAYHSTEKELLDRSCTYALAAPGSRKVIFTLGGNNRSAFISDDGNTILFHGGFATDTALNDATNNPDAADYWLDWMTYIAKKAGMVAGIAIKYDGQASDAIIAKWFDVDSTKDDFNGDSKSDILIRHTSGQLYMYEMDGNVRAGKNVGGLSTVWSVEGISDFGGDGKADILIRHTSGHLYMYEMDGNIR